MRNKIKNFLLVSSNKIKRVIEEFEKTNKGKEMPDSDLLAQYDKIGGLIVEVRTVKKVETKRKVVTGSFYDFEEGKGRKKPKLTYK